MSAYVVTLPPFSRGLGERWINARRCTFLCCNFLDTRSFNPSFSRPIPFSLPAWLFLGISRLSFSRRQDVGSTLPDYRVGSSHSSSLSNGYMSKDPRSSRGPAMAGRRTVRGGNEGERETHYCRPPPLPETLLSPRVLREIARGRWPVSAFLCAEGGIRDCLLSVHSMDIDLQEDGVFIVEAWGEDCAIPVISGLAAYSSRKECFSQELFSFGPRHSLDRPGCGAPNCHAAVVRR